MSRTFTSILLAGILTAAGLPATAQTEQAFPEASPESVGLSTEALTELAAEVQSYVEREMAVGAELMVIKDRQTVLHEAFGWRDREAELPMERDTLFNIRSMTKPVTGAAAQVLIDEGRLALDDQVSTYLPGFDNEASGDITIEQLLTHTSGLPLTTVSSVDQYESLEAMANAAGESGPEFEPGSKFWYSDTGADTLGAVVEQASETPLGAFVTERLLDPLGMADTYYAGDPADPRLDRIASLYVGKPGEWTRFWGPEEDPFYPYAWGSQSLYGTPRDYARFLAMWMDAGQAGGTAVLSPEAVTRTLTPATTMGQLGSDAPYPTQFPDLTVYHGQMALLHVDGEPEGGLPPPGVAPTILGYSGSDGTIAWAWPDLDLMILYFTQSRGGSTAIRLEAEIERLLLDPSTEPALKVPVALSDLIGTYVADFGPFRNEPFEILWRDNELALDIPSQLIFGLEQVPGDERWGLRGVPAELTFVRDESGAVTIMELHQGGDTFELPKGEPEPIEEVALRADEVEPYLGWYREDGSDREVEVVLQDGRLALRIPETAEPLELFPPSSDDGWRLRMNPAVEIRFSEQDGSVDAYVVHAPGGEATFTRIDGATPQHEEAAE